MKKEKQKALGSRQKAEGSLFAAYCLVPSAFCLYSSFIPVLERPSACYCLYEYYEET
jgi:hypothetical protein